MSVQKYLPSAQFAVIVGALVVSGGLVFGAQYITKRPEGTSLSPGGQVITDNWQQTLDQIQANSGVSLPQTPSDQSVADLVAGAKSSNLTDSVAHTLLIKLADAKAQGLGNDMPTQDVLVAQALAQAGQASSTVYTAADVTTVAQTKDSLHTYGNAFMTINAAHQDANASVVLASVGYGLDYNDPKQLTKLPAAAADYQSLARALARLPVPKTLSPLHLQVVNDLSAMSSAVLDMDAVLTDPLRGLRGLQEFNSLADEANRVLTTLAGEFNKNGILFTKDEPGASWSAFLSATSQ